MSQHWHPRWHLTTVPNTYSWRKVFCAGMWTSLIWGSANRKLAFGPQVTSEHHRGPPFTLCFCAPLIAALASRSHCQGSPRGRYCPNWGASMSTTQEAISGWVGEGCPFRVQNTSSAFSFIINDLTYRGMKVYLQREFKLLWIKSWLGRGSRHSTGNCWRKHC